MGRATILLLSLLLIKTSPAYAALIDRGGGLIYDTDLRVTWLQDANYVDTINYDDLLYGHDTGGRLTWEDARDWVSSLVYYDPLRGVYWDDWRLPESNDCLGFNCQDSEMGHLFYISLNNEAWYSGCAVGLDCGLVNTGPFLGLESNYYWSATQLFLYGEDLGYVFNFGYGSQTALSKSNLFLVWPVRDGDVILYPVPLMGTDVLILLALTPVPFFLLWGNRYQNSI